MSNCTPQNWVGSYIIPRGGGWSAEVSKDDFWSTINSKAIVALTKKPQANPDKILDKISDSGYSSLSKKEKEKLFNASKK